MNNVPVGIVGIGVYLPDNYMTAKEISEATGGTWSEDAVINKLGIRQKRIPSDKPCDGTQEMGALAALDCLKNTGIDPMEIDASSASARSGRSTPSPPPPAISRTASAPAAPGASTCRTAAAPPCRP